MASLSQLTAQINEAKENRVGVIELLVQLESYMPDVVDGMIQEYLDKISYLSQNGQKILESSNPSHAKLKKDLEFELAFGRGLDNLFNGKLNQGSLSWEGFQQEVRMLNGSYNNGTILQDKNVQGGTRPSNQGQTAPPANRSSVQTPAPIGGRGAKPQSEDEEMAEILRAIAEAEAAEQKLKDQVRIDADAMGARRDMRSLANRDRDAEQARRDLAGAAGIESRLRQEYEQADDRRRRDDDIRAERDLDGLRDRFGRAGQEEARMRDLATMDARAERDADVLRQRVARDAEAERAAQEMRGCVWGVRGIASIGSKFQQEQDRIERDRQERDRRRREEEEAEKSLQALRAKMDSEAKAQRDRERRAREDAEAEKEAKRLRQLLAEDSKRNREAELEADKMRDFARKDPKKQREMERNTRNERESEGLRDIMREIAGAQKRGANIASKENLGYQYSDEDEPTSKRYNANAAASVIGGSMGTLLNQDLLSKGLGGGLLNKDNQNAYTISEKHKLEEELRNVSSQLDSMKSLVNEEEQKYLTLKDKLHSMRTLGNEVETDIENIRQEREEEEQATKDLEKEIADLEKDLKELDQEHQEVLRNDEQRLDVHQEIRKERSKHKELLQKLEVEIEEYKSSYESLMKKWQEEINGGPAVASAPLMGNYLGDASRTRFIGQGEPYSLQPAKPSEAAFSVSDRLAAIRSRISDPVAAYQPTLTSSLSRLPPTTLDYRTTQYTSNRPDPFTQAAATSGVTIRSASRDAPTLRASIQPNFYQPTSYPEYRSGSVGPQQQSFQSGSYADRYLSTLRK